MNKKEIKLTSNATFAYKYLFPIMFFSIFLILLFSIFVNIFNIELPVRIVLTFFSFIFCLLMLPLIKLHFIYYNESYTIIIRAKIKKKIANRDVVKVKRFMFYFYRLFYNERGVIRKAIFSPHIMGVFISFWGKPKSIKKYESALGNP